MAVTTSPHSTLNHIPEVEYALQPWLVVFSAALFFFYEFIQMNMFNAIDPSLITAFSTTATQLGGLSATYFYGNILFLFQAGLLLDRFSTRKMLLTAISIAVICTFLFSLSTHLWFAELCRFITGLASTFCMLSAVRLASRWFPSHRIALVIGLVVTMAMLGGMFAQTPMTLLTQDLGWRHAVMVNCTIGLFFIVLIWIFVKDFPKNLTAAHEHEQNQLIRMGFWHSIWIAIRNPQNWLAGIFTNLLSLPVIVLGAVWGVLYLTQVRNISTEDASFVTSMIFVGMIIGSPITGWISDRIGRRKIPMLIGAILSIITALLIIYIPTLHLPCLLALFLALGFFSSVQVISYPLVVESNPLAVTTTAEGLTCTLVMAAGIFQQLYGYIMDTQWNGELTNGIRIYSAHSYQSAMLILPIGFTVALIIGFFLKETNCKTSVNLDY